MIRLTPQSNKKAAGLETFGGRGEHVELYAPGAGASPGGVLELAAALDALEFATVSAVLAIHPAGIAQAEQAGLEAWIIEAPDLRAIFTACQSLRWGDRLDALGRAVQWLYWGGHWGREWTPEKVIDFATFRPDGPSAYQWASALVKVHEAWSAAAEEHGPMYFPPMALGQLMPVKIGLALARLARWSGIPLEWIHHQFALTCTRQDAREAIRKGWVA